MPASADLVLPQAKDTSPVLDALHNALGIQGGAAVQTLVWGLRSGVWEATGFSAVEAAFRQ